MADSEQVARRAKHSNKEVMQIGLYLTQVSEKGEIGDDPEELLERCQKATGISMTMYHLKRYCSNLEIPLPKNHSSAVKLRVETKIDLLNAQLKAVQQQVSELQIRFTNLETALGT